MIRESYDVNAWEIFKDFGTFIGNWEYNQTKKEIFPTCLCTEDPSHCRGRHFKTVCIQDSDCPENADMRISEFWRMAIPGSYYIQ